MRILNALPTHALSAESAFTLEALLITPSPSTGIKVSIDLTSVLDPVRARLLAAVLFGNPALSVTSIVGLST